MKELENCFNGFNEFMGAILSSFIFLQKSLTHTKKHKQHKKHKKHEKETT